MTEALQALAPSPWVERWYRAIKPGGAVLDLACGGGRHARLLADAGFIVHAVDIDVSAVGAAQLGPRVTIIEADLENSPWPFAGRHYDAVVVTNYLHRPLFTYLLDALAPGALLVYETFAAGNEKFGKPSNPNFLLRPGELLELVRGRLRVRAYEDVYVEQPRPAMVQRICALNAA